MSWPQAQEYNEAIQNPNTAFFDTDLRRGSVKQNKLGLPQAISGGFASVYQVTTPSGTWAVRCFIREIADGHRRYEEISKALKSLTLPYTAPFEFQRRGIQVAGRALPIVKMQWMRGDLLNDYVAANLQNSMLIAQLAKKWVSMVANLKANNLAHCDLQHGNVLVVNHELKLIDYDGMFVPAFSGLKANEQGHPNYQHPKRTESDFGPHTDHFSAWVIYAALRVLAVAPELHSLAKALGREDCLLFNRDDFTSPHSSQIFSELRTSSDSGVVRLAQHLTSLIAQAPRAIPALDAAPFGEPAVINVPTPVATNEWWREHAKDASPEPKPAKVDPVTIGPNPKAQREMLCFSIASLAAFCACYLTGALGIVGYLGAQLAIVIGAMVRLDHHFKACPEGAARERFLQALFLKDEELADKRARLETKKSTISDCESKRERLTAQLQSDIAAVTTEHGGEMRKVYEQQAIVRSQIDARRRSLLDEERRDLRIATERFEQEARNIQLQISAANGKRTQLIADALLQYRNAALNNFLGQHPISGAQFYGVSYRYKQNLIYDGIRTAADVSYGRVARVEGFGPKRTATIIAWRKNLENHYTSRLPTTLPASEIQRVEQGIQMKCSELENALRMAEQNLTHGKRGVETAYTPRKAALDAEENRNNENTQQKISAITGSRESILSALRGRFEGTKRELDREIATAQALARSLEGEISRIQAWHRDVGAPTKRAYEAVTFERFAHAVFTSKYQP